MQVKQVIAGGKLTSSYMSSWNNELQLTVEGGHEFSVKIDEGELRDLVNRLNERIASIDKEREEERQAEVEAAVGDLMAKAEEEANDDD